MYSLWDKSNYWLIRRLLFRQKKTAAIYMTVWLLQYFSTGIMPSNAWERMHLRMTASSNLNIISTEEPLLLIGESLYCNYKKVRYDMIFFSKFVIMKLSWRNVQTFIPQYVIRWEVNRYFSYSINMITFSDIQNDNIFWYSVISDIGR